MERASLLLTAVVICLATATTRASERLDQTIDYLINTVATADATFIRNGEPHSATEAAHHIRLKYEHFKKEIKTPEDFIRLSASKSILTGQPYLVRLPNGEVKHLDTWLTDQLKRHHKEHLSDQ